MYVALLRGINVGGNNIIPMADLKACFEDAGFTSVRTYIQSGNVVFDAPRTVQARVVARIESALSKRFDYQARVVVRSHQELEAIVRVAPRGFGKDKEHRYNVVYVREPAAPQDVMKVVTPREGVDAAYLGPGVLYFSTLFAKATRSSLTKIVGTPIYQSVTIRNWNTTVKLEDMSRGVGGPADGTQKARDRRAT